MDKVLRNNYLVINDKEKDGKMQGSFFFLLTLRHKLNRLYA